MVIVCLSEAVELAKAEAPGPSVNTVTVRRNTGAKVTATDALVVGERHDVKTRRSLVDESRMFEICPSVVVEC